MKHTVSSLMNLAKSANGRARNRTIGEKEAQAILDLVENASDSDRKIRVYSFDGFVANSYKYHAEIRYFEARRTESGEFNIIASYGDAKRPHGEGALITVNGRALSTMSNVLKYRPFVEFRNCIDEYRVDHVYGLFLPSGWCVAGLMIKPPYRERPRTREGEARAIILFNRAIGIWRDPDPQLPPLGFKPRNSKSDT